MDPTPTVAPLLEAAPTTLREILNQVRGWLSKGKMSEARRLATRLQSNPSQRPEASVVLAEVALAENDPREALRLVESNGGSVAARIRGEALLRIGLLREAAESYRAALAIPTDEEDASACWLGLGLALFRMGDRASRAESERALRRALHRGDRGNAHRAARALADSSRARKDFVAETRYLRRALFLDPHDEEAQRLLCFAYEASDSPEAQRAYHRARATDTARPWALTGLARLAARAGELRKADGLWREVIRLAPLDPAPRVARARLALASNPPRPALADRLYRAVIGLDPDHAEAQLHLADRAWNRNAHAEALSRYEIYLDATRTVTPPAPDRVRARARVAEILTGSDLREPAARRRADVFLRAAREEVPRDPALRIAAARLAQAEGDLLAARRHLQAARRESPTDSRIPFETGLLHLSEGDLARADAEFESALALTRAPKILAERARLSLRRGVYPLAARLFRELLSFDMRNDWALAGWAIALARSGRPARALFAWDRFLTRIPASPEARLGKAEALLHLRRAEEARVLALPLARRGGDLGRTARGLLGASELVRGAPGRARRRLHPMRKFPRVLEDLRPLLSNLGYEPVAD